MATAQGKQGIWFLLFPDRENTGNLVVTLGKFLRHRENIFDCIYQCKKHVFLHIFSKKFGLALLSICFFQKTVICTISTSILTILFCFKITFATSINQTYSGTLKQIEIM